MPITIHHPIKRLSEQEFHDLDFQIMKLAFDIHNRLGRFYDEKIYQNELIALCRRAGLEAATEVRIELTHNSFRKNLFIDLLIESGSIYELKAARSIVPAYRVQTLGYLFLTGTQHGKIINFRPPSVEHEFVSTSLTPTDRRIFSIRDNNWEKDSPSAHRLKTLLIDLLNDWGTFLNTEFYKEALCHLYDIGKNIVQSVKIKSSSTVLGTQNIPLISPTESFCISSIRNGTKTYQTHLCRFLEHTNLKHLHWININNSNVQFRTLSNKNYSDLNYSD